MKKVLLSFMAFAAGAAMAVAQDPVYPSALDFTLNGEKELAGVSVSQTMKSGSLTIDITGESSANVITMDFELPEGWDYALIGSVLGGSDAPFTTRSSHWLPVSLATQAGYQKGSYFKFPVNGLESLGTIYLVKGENVWEYPIDISCNVKPGVVADDPVVDTPSFPDSFVVKTFNEGLEVTQGYNKWDTYDIIVKGEVNTATFPIVIEVPEGWDGFVCYNWSHQGDVTITETTQNGTRAEEIEWISVEKLLENGYVKGNRFTFEPTYVDGTNNYQTIELHLYKGDMAIKEDILSLLVYVSEGEAEAPELPIFPDKLDLTTDCEDVTIWQGNYEDIAESGIVLTEEEIDALSMFMPEKAIVLNGTTENGTLTVDFDLPKGWEGVLPVKVLATDEEGDYYTTRANVFEPYLMDEFLEMMKWMSNFDISMTPGKQLTFPIENQKQVYGCLLYMHDDGTLAGSPDYAGDYLDIANAFVLVINVTSDAETAELEYPEHLDITLNGETSLPGVTVTQEIIPYNGNDYLTIGITGTCDADEITIDMTTPEGWDGMLTFSSYGEEDEDEIEPLRVKVNMDEESWTPLMFASWMGLTEGNTLTFSVDGKEHSAMAFLIKGDNYYTVNIDFIFEVSKAGGSAVESINAIDSKATYYDMNGNKIAKPEKGIYVKVADGKASKIVAK
ncbi:MAG: hypothetical protein K2N35_03915 [Muribaculaceae bacterium]|nr:hypothetical protein [Muribaculaceae bacterium]